MLHLLLGLALRVCVYTIFLFVIVILHMQCLFIIKESGLVLHVVHESLCTYFISVRVHLTNNNRMC